MKKWSLALLAVLFFIGLKLYAGEFLEKQSYPRRIWQNLLADQKSRSQDGLYEELIEEIVQNGVCFREGSDDLRIPFVNLQAAFEQMAAYWAEKGEISNLAGLIHTPAPATPLCTKADMDDAKLRDPNVAWSDEKILTIQSRTEILRKMLSISIPLHIIFPQGGLEQRTPVQQAVYQEVKKEFPSLWEHVLHMSYLDREMTGATYFFKDQEGKPWFFSLKGVQANNAKNASQWAVWFGSLDHEAVQERIEQVFGYLHKAGGPYFSASDPFSD
ncbi:MAG: hypothetical protein Tsb0015_12150 [Simkaniaceae bacterium]